MDVGVSYTIAITLNIVVARRGGAMFTSCGGVMRGNRLVTCYSAAGAPNSTALYGAFVHRLCISRTASKRHACAMVQEAKDHLPHK